MDCLTDPKMRAYFSQLLGAGEEILWFQEGRFGSPGITQFAFMILGISVFWAIIVSAILWLGLSLGTPASHPWWVWSWNAIVYCAVIFLPFLAALELLRSLKSSVHVLSHKRLFLTNTRWPGYSLQIHPIDTLRLKRSPDGESKVVVEVSPKAKWMSFLLRFTDRTMLSNIDNPDLFASVLAKHGVQTVSTTGAFR